MMRNIFALITGLIAVSIVIAVIESISLRIYPPKYNYEFRNKEALRQLMKNTPKGALILKLLAHAAGTFVGGLITFITATKKKTETAIFIGFIVLLMGITNLYMIPHPYWFIIADVVIYIPSAYTGALFAEKLLS
jgi:hypothetical protein